MSSPCVGNRRPGSAGVPTRRQSRTALPYDVAARGVRSTHTSAIGNGSLGQGTLSSAAVKAAGGAAVFARGTRFRRDSRTSLPVMALRLSFFAGIERFLMLVPLIV